MRRRTRPPLICRRKGCSHPRRKDDTFCLRCWAAVPGPIKRGLRAARAARDAARMTALWIEASIAVAAAMPAHSISSTQAYSRTAALLGEHDEAGAHDD